MYSLLYSPSALKALDKLDQTTQKRILTAVERLRIRPASCDIKRLVGRPGYRFRVGDYRVIFDTKQEELHILILMIGHRKNVYD